MAAPEAAIPKADEGTFQPNVPPTNHHTEPSEFVPLDLPDRDFEVQSLPNTPLGLFEEFLPPWLIAKWVEYFEKGQKEGPWLPRFCE
ncbi:hypothetical protein EV127DRAFT_54545 [Xylaria flabelliformis]|nr:hypothetical protein EV127DRAFT_54545 [Xylaria flabelliformis]